MTALAALNPASMDFLHPDDEMDLASSPARPTEDLDVDLGDVREPSPYPVLGQMTEDQQKLTADEAAGASDSRPDPADEDMFDENLVDLEDPGENERDLSAARRQEKHTPALEEDDFLYEDEEEKDTLADSGVGEQSQEEAAELLFDEEVQDPASTAAGVNSASVAQSELQDPLNQLITTADTSDPTLRSLKEDFSQDFDTATGEPGLGGLPQDAARENSNANNHLQQDHPRDPRADSHPAPETNIPNENGSHQSPSDHSALHPVKVQYLGSEMGLFPPFENDDSDVYFLHDVGLAFQPLDKMLAACREALEGSLGHDDELVLDVPSLALHISEGSRHAAQLSLSQILDVYVLLGQNQDLEHVAPLQCSLSSRVCLASQYAYMHSSAHEGRSLAAYVEENGPYVNEGEVDLPDEKKAEIAATSLLEQNEDEGEAEGAILQPEDEEDYTEEYAPNDPSQSDTEAHQDEAAETTPNDTEAALDFDQPQADETVMQASKESDLDLPPPSSPSTSTANLPFVEEDQFPADIVAVDDHQNETDEAIKATGVSNSQETTALTASSDVVGPVNGPNGLSEARGSDLLDETFHDVKGINLVEGEEDSSTHLQTDQAALDAGGEDDDPVSFEGDALNVDEGAEFQADNYEGDSANVETGVEVNTFLDEPKPALKVDETVNQAETYDDDLLDFNSDDDGAEQPEKASTALPDPTDSTNHDSGRPSTPASVKKRKVEDVKEKDDDYGLWDLDTPDRKRGRAS